MPVFKPFRGIRPHKDHEATFPTHPLDNFTQAEITEKAQKENLMTSYPLFSWYNLLSNLNYRLCF